MSNSSGLATLTDASVRFGDRTVWEHLDLRVESGEFVAVLGPNGSGKSTLLKVLLGLIPLTSGSAMVGGLAVRRGNSMVGYIPQHATAESAVSLRGADLVGYGVDGHHWGIGWRRRHRRATQTSIALNAVGAQDYSTRPIGLLSGGELQRLRAAQALVSNPKLLLCDEPFLSLDLARQAEITRLIDRHRRNTNCAVLFVTHELNPILPLVDRVVYLVDGQFRIGTPGEIMTSSVLSELYGTEVDVLNVRGRMIVVGGDDAVVPLPGHHAHHAHEDEHR